MGFDDLRRLLTRWARRQALIQRMHVVGPHARGAQRPGDALALVIELDTGFDATQDEAAVARWEAQIASACTGPVHVTIHHAHDRVAVAHALREAHVCIFERSAQGRT